MTRLAIVGVAALLLPPLQDDVEYARKLDRARGAVDVARRNLEEAQRQAQTSAQAHRQADAALEQAEAQVRLVERRIAAAENAVRASVDKIQQMIDFHQRQLDKAEAEGKSETLRVELAKAVMQWTQKRDRRLRDSGLLEHKARIERLLPPAEAARRAAREAAMRARETAVDDGKRVEEAREALDKARRELEGILKEGEEKFRHLSPPHLQEVAVRRGDSTVYHAVWVSRKAEADERIAIIEAGLEGARAHRRDMQAKVEEWFGPVQEAQLEYNAATDAYVAAIRNSAWKVILVELADAGVTIFRDFKTYGPYAFAVEAGFRVSKALGGGSARKFEDPVTGPGTGSDLLGTAGGIAKDKSIKSGIKLILQSAVTGGQRTRWDHVPPVNWRDWKGWRDAMNQGELQKLLRSQKLWPGGDAKLNEWVKGALNLKPKELLESIKSRLKSPSTWTGLLKSMGQGAAKEAILKAWADDARLAAWRDWMAAEQVMVQALAQMKAAGLLRDVADEVIEALHEELELARKDAAAAVGHRRLDLKVDAVLEGTDPFTLQLTFSGEVEMKRVLLGGRELTATPTTGVHDAWTAPFTLEGLPDSAPLVVEALGRASRKALDSPSTEVKYDPTDGSWRGYEPGEDRNHRLKLKPVKPGRTLLFLVDCSGSMEQNDRMKNAKEAVRRALQSPDLGPDDEFGLMAFFDSHAIQLLVPFTRDRDTLIAAVSRLEPTGDTPLAESIRRAGRYLQDSARTTGRILIVLSDGQDTCDGDPQAAAEEVRRRGVEVR